MTAQLDLSQTQQFIETVYPVTLTGNLVVCAPKLNSSEYGKMDSWHFARRDINNLLSRVQQLDTENIPSIYLGVATMNPVAPGRRGGEKDVKELTYIWSDLDFGSTGHKHNPSEHNNLPNPPDAEQAWAIIEAAKLPLPTLCINSGGGLYAEWLLDVPFVINDENRSAVKNMVGRWQTALAKGAESLLYYYGTGVSDLSRVLRAPGTVNRKVPYIPRLCHIGAHRGPKYQIDELFSRLQDAERALEIVPSQPTAPQQSQQQGVPSAEPDPLIVGRKWQPVAPGTGDPLDDFETRTDWADILCHVGWQEVLKPPNSSDPTRYWVRPGKSLKDGDGHAATTSRRADRDRMFNWSDNAGLPTKESMTKQFVFTQLYHNGDWHAARKALYGWGYGAREPEQQIAKTLVTNGQLFIDGGAFFDSVGEDELPLWGDDDTALWVPGESLMIAGPPGVGKSTLAHLVVFAALGLTPPGVAGTDSQQQVSVLTWPVMPIGKKVLYLALDRPKQIARAMKRLATAEARVVVKERLIVRNGPFALNLLEKKEWFLEQAQENNVGLIVVDSLKDVVPNPSDETAAGNYNLLRQYLLAAGIEWIELHHNRKANGDNQAPKTLDDIYGSRFLTAGAGSVLSLFGEPGATVIAFSQVKTPSGELFPKYVSIDKEAGTMRLYESTSIEMVLSAAPQGMTALEVAVHLHGTPKPSRNQKESTRVQLERRVAKGALIKEERDRVPGVEGSGTRYRLAGDCWI